MNMNTNIKELTVKLEKVVLEKTGYDISNVPVFYGSRNLCYVISNSIKPVAIRISKSDNGSREAIASELLFMDYLKQFIHTICQAIPFCGSLVNTVIVDNESFDIVVFKKGNGYPCLNCTTPGFLKASGSLLGKIHSASIQAGKERFHFKRKKLV